MPAELARAALGAELDVWSQQSDGDGGGAAATAAGDAKRHRQDPDSGYGSLAGRMGPAQIEQAVAQQAAALAGSRALREARERSILRSLRRCVIVFPSAKLPIG